MTRIHPAGPWIAVWIIVGIGGVLPVLVPKAWLPDVEPGIRRFQIPVGEGLTLSQTFVMPAPDFEAIDVYVSSTGGPMSGALRFELHDFTDGVRILSRYVPAAELGRGRGYRLAFDRQRDSLGREFRLDVSAPDPTRLATGVALWANKGDAYDAGVLFINDRERWADLAFTTHAPAGRSHLARIVGLSTGASGTARGFLTLLAMAAYWVVLAVVLRMTWRTLEAI